MDICQTQPRASKKRIRDLVQMHLDVGQKNFHTTTCNVCGLTYCKGNAVDEKYHGAYHNTHLRGPLFQASEICLLVASEIGYASDGLIKKDSKVLLFISSSKRVAGCLIAEPINQAYYQAPGPAMPLRGGGKLQLSSTPMTDEAGVVSDHHLIASPCQISMPTVSDQPSSNKLAASATATNPEELLSLTPRVFKVALGVRALWVAPECRRQGIATKLVDAARCHFVLGAVVQRHDVAYFQPSDDCCNFGKAYCKGNALAVYD